MANLIAIPLEDDFETTLASSWDGGAGSISVNDIPSADTPTGDEYTYIVVNPGKTNMQVAKITAWSGSTLTATADTIEKGDGVDYSAQTHAAGSIVRFSNNYQFWKDIQTAINSKADQTEIDTLLGNFTFTDSAVESTGSMTFSDGETAPVTLKTLATGAPADQYVAVSENDTTVGHLEDKLTAGTGITLTKNNPAGNENLAASVDTSVIASKTYVDASVKASITAGEDLLENDAVRMGLENIEIKQTEGTSTNAESYIGYNTSYQKSGQSFYVSGKNKTLESISVKLLKQGSPTGNLTMKVYSDTGSTLVATATNTIDESTLTASYADYTFTFSSEAVSDGLYYIEISDDRADSTSNYSKWAYCMTNCYLYGTGYIISSTNTWTPNSGDKSFTVTLGGEDGEKVYKCDASYYDTVGFIGFANAATTSGNDVKIVTNNIKGGFSGLTVGALQYLSDTAGELSETQGTNYKPIGKAISATEVMIENNIKYGISDQKSLVVGTEYYADRDLMVVARATYGSSAGDLEGYIGFDSTPTTLVARNTVDSGNNSKQTITFIAPRGNYYRVDLGGTNVLNNATAFPL